MERGCDACFLRHIHYKTRKMAGDILNINCLQLSRPQEIYFDYSYMPNDPDTRLLWRTAKLSRVWGKYLRCLLRRNVLGPRFAWRLETGHDSLFPTHVYFTASKRLNSTSKTDNYCYRHSVLNKLKKPAVPLRPTSVSGRYVVNRKTSRSFASRCFINRWHSRMVIPTYTLQHSFINSSHICLQISTYRLQSLLHNQVMLLDVTTYQLLPLVSTYLLLSVFRTQRVRQSEDRHVHSPVTIL
jgi:hypothetical protein